MATAKDIVVKPIKSDIARNLVKKIHYSGKVVNNSSLHLGVFLNDRLEGVMSFGAPMVKRNVHSLVRDTKWNGMLELNRMAFSDALPRNSESRALSIAFKLIKKHYPHIEWILSFADGTQCGDGTIYRASGFYLTQIAKNQSLIEFPDGTRITSLTLTVHGNSPQVADLCRRLGVEHRIRSIKEWYQIGGKPLDGYQLRYIYFLNKDAKERLTCPILPFSDLDKCGARMYKGQKL